MFLFSLGQSVPPPTKNKAFVSWTMREKQFRIIRSLTQEDLCAFLAWFWVLGTESWIRHSVPLLLALDWPWGRGSIEITDHDFIRTLRAILALWDRKTNQDDLIMCDREGGLAFVHNKNLMYSFTKISLDCIYILLHQTIWLHFLDFSYMLHTPAFVPSLPVSPAFCVPQRQAAMPTSVTELAVSSGRYRGTTPLHGCLLVFLVSERHLYRGLPWTQSEKALHPSHTLSPHLVLSSCLTEQA